MNEELKKYIEIIKQLKPILNKNYKVIKLGIFGSMVKGEQKNDSDIDIIVELSEPIGLKFIELRYFLEEKLGRKIDLVSSEGISPYLRQYIEREVFYI